MKVSDLKIGTRLGGGFSAVLFLMMCLTGLAIFSLNKSQQHLDEILHTNVYKMTLLQDMSESVHVATRVIRTVILLQDQADMGRELAKVTDARIKYDKAFSELEKTPSNEKGQAIRAKIREKQSRARELNNKVIELAKSNMDAEAAALLMSKAGPAAQEWQDALDENIQLQKESNAAAEAAAKHSASQARTLMIVLSGIALMFGTLVAWIITRSIAAPITQAVKVAQTVASGDLTSEITVSSSDETGQLLDALKRMNDSLKKIVGQVRNGTETISTAASQIAGGNLDLSSRTEEQASSLEETAASMEELTSTVKQNADNARQANQLAATASEVATRGGEVVSQVVHTMEDINTSSKKIVDIITVIDGIAFQTNILALNAAVEAARAGEQGRGFAVVASEVRSLAQRSASAAKEIKELITSSVEKVQGGSKLVQQAGSTMEDIVSSVKHVADIMSEITAASREQSQGIEQVNQAISQMDQVTQQNAALVEEAAAAAESMQEQANTLVNLVNVFKLDENTSEMSHPTEIQSDARPGLPAPTLKLVAAR